MQIARVLKEFFPKKREISETCRAVSLCSLTQGLHLISIIRRILLLIVCCTATAFDGDVGEPESKSPLNDNKCKINK